LCIGTEGELSCGTSQKRCEQIRQAAQRANVQIVSVATGAFWGMSLTDPKAAVRRKALAFLKDAVRVAGQLQAGALLVVPGCVHADFIPNCPEVPYDEAYKTSRAQIRAALPTAKRYRVAMCIENVWNKFLLSPLEFGAFVRGFKSPWVGAYYDVANNVAYGVSSHWVLILGKAIKRVHFKEYKKQRNPDGSMTWTGFPEGFAVPLGEGDVNYPAVLKALKKIRYAGPVTYEWLNFTDDPTVVARCSQEMDRVLGAA
jgi:hexulose-6-phosphate isomerase